MENETITVYLRNLHMDENGHWMGWVSMSPPSDDKGKKDAYRYELKIPREAIIEVEQTVDPSESLE